MSGAIPPLPQYAFMAWCSVTKNTGTSLPLPLVKLRCYKMMGLEKEARNAYRILKRKPLEKRPLRILTQRWSAI
jgi:hypothetical protein